MNFYGVLSFFSALTYANIHHLKFNTIAVQTFSYDFVFSTCTLYSSVKVKDNILAAYRMNEKIKSKNGLQCHKHKLTNLQDPADCLSG